MSPPLALRVSGLSKTYTGGRQALAGIDLDVRKGEIFALLGPNGAGKTTLISTICGIVRPTAGRVEVEGRDIQRDYRWTRRAIGLVPQELTTDAFETVIATVRFSRGLFGFGPDDALIERILTDLALWDRRDNKIATLSGGMKRRLLIAKALSHEPRLLFLDEPTAGVDVELRRDMWRLVRNLQASGVTIILTTHYIEEAEAMADRVGIMRAGRMIAVEDKATLLRRFGSKHLTVHLERALPALPPELEASGIVLEPGGAALSLSYDDLGGGAGLGDLLARLGAARLPVKDIETRETSLEDIFVTLVGSR